MWRLMAEEVEVNGPGSPLTDDSKLVPNLLGVEHRTRQRAEPSCLGNGDHHVGPDRTGHGSLDDRQLNLEEVLNAMIRPHDLFLVVKTVPILIAPWLSDGEGPLAFSEPLPSAPAP